MKPAAAVAGATRARAAARADARLIMRRFYDPPLASASMILRSCEGGAPKVGPEAIGEVRRAGVAEVGRDPREGLLAEALDRGAQPQVVQVLGQRATGDLAEHAGEVVRGDVQLAGQRGERQRLLEAGEQEVLGGLGELGAVAAGGAGRRPDVRAGHGSRG